MWDKIRSDYFAGVPFFDLAKKYGVSVPLIEKYIEKVNVAILSGQLIPVDVQGIHFEIDWKGVKTAFLSGVPKEEICLIYGCAYKEMRDFLKSEGLNTRFHKANIDFSILVQEYHTTNKSIKDIAVKYGFIPNTLVCKFKRMGVVLRSRSEQMKLACTHRGAYRTKVDEQRLEELYASGASMRTMSKEFKVSNKTIAKYMQKLGLEIPTSEESLALFWKKKRGNYVTFTRWNEAIEMYNQGFSFGEIARKYSLTPHYVKVGLRTRGVKFRTREEWKELVRKKYWDSKNIDWKKLIGEYVQGRNLKDLNKKYHVSKMMIRKCLEKNGIPIRSHSESIKIGLKKNQSSCSVKNVDLLKNVAS